MSVHIHGVCRYVYMQRGRVLGRYVKIRTVYVMGHIKLKADVLMLNFN